MKKILLFSLVSCMIILASCTANEPNLSDDSTVGLNPFRVELSEAQSLADKMFASVYSGTRSNRKVSSVEFIGNRTRTSSDKEPNSYYIFNYGDKEGFAIVSADKRQVPVYAISDQGELHASDTLDNPGLRWYFSNVLSGSSIGSGIPVDTTKHPLITLPIETRIVYSKPLITGFKSQFHQESPYNKYCPGVVGCVPLACGTVMGYHRWPSNYGGYTFDWDAMNKNSVHDKWARLFQLLGNVENCDAHYGYQVTAVYPLNNVIRAFSNFGYKNVIISNFTDVSISEELQKGYPVLFDGRLVNDSDAGHTWVVDGGFMDVYKIPGLPNEDGSQTDYVKYTTYYHCIWGMKDNPVGYYLYDITAKTIGGEPFISDSDDKTPTPIYRGLKVVYNIRPNK